MLGNGGKSDGIGFWVVLHRVHRKWVLSVWKYPANLLGFYWPVGYPLVGGIHLDNQVVWDGRKSGGTLFNWFFCQGYCKQVLSEWKHTTNAGDLVVFACQLTVNQLIPGCVFYFTVLTHIMLTVS
jgi:hypothetical protein